MGPLLNVPGALFRLSRAAAEFFIRIASHRAHGCMPECQRSRSNRVHIEIRPGKANA